MCSLAICLALVQLALDTPPAEPAPPPVVRAVPGGADASWVDVDADGLMDLHLASEAGGHWLLRNRGDGGFEDVTASSGLAALGGAQDAAWADADRDGRADVLLVGADGRPRLFQQVAPWSFEELANEPALDELAGVSAARWLDYDADGWLDLQLTGPGGAPILLHGREGRGFERVALPELAVGVPHLLDPRTPLAGARESAPTTEGAASERGAARGPLVEGTRRPAGPPAPASAGVAPAGSSGGGTFAGSPAAAYGPICADALMDQAVPGTCMNASSDPTLGMLYPQTVDLNVDPAGQVGLGTVTPEQHLHVMGPGYLGGAGRFESADQESAVQIVGSNVSGVINTARVELHDSDEPTNGAYMSITGSAGDTAGDLRFVTGGITGPTAGERMRITKDGRVGIGTAAPQAPLDVSGELHVTDVVEGHRFIASTGGSAVDIRSVGAPLWVNSAENQPIYLLGSAVGVGTTTPSSQLDVAGNLEAANFYIGDSAAGTAGTVGFNGPDGPSIQCWGNDTAQEGRMFLIAGGAARMTFLADGRVGVGTVVPEAKLDVAGNVRMAVLYADGGAKVGTDAPPPIGVTGKLLVTNGAFDNPAILAASSSTNQNYGAIHGWSNTRPAVFAEATGSGTALRAQHFSGVAGLFEGHVRVVGNTELQGDLSVTNGGAQTGLVVDAATERVGIGTNVPIFNLQVDGTAGKPGGGSWSNSSDRRLKKDIRELEGALDTLLALRGVTYEYIDPEAICELPGRRTGMIAQEVEEVVPDWVDEGEDGYKRLTYRGFEALTVEALRDLAQQLEASRAEARELRAELDALRRTIGAR